MIKVGFVINFDPKKWLGGYNFIINLIKSLSLIKNKKINPVLIVNKNFNTNNIKKLNAEIIKTDFFYNQGFFKRIFNKILIILFGRSYLYDNFFKKLKIQVLSHASFFLGEKSHIKSFPWIPDFQFYHYPNNFSLKNRILKRINILLMGYCSTKIILSSKSAKNDLKIISTKAYEKSLVNSFVFYKIEKKNDT